MRNFGLFLILVFKHLESKCRVNKLKIHFRSEEFFVGSVGIKDFFLKAATAFVETLKFQVGENADSP